MHQEELRPRKLVWPLQAMPLARAMGLSYALLIAYVSLNPFDFDFHNGIALWAWLGAPTPRFITLFDENNPDQVYTNGATWNYNSALSDKMETLSYIMLFHNGESGWGWEDRKKIDIRRYVASRMLRPERNNAGELLST